MGRERPLPWMAGRLPRPVRGLLGIVVALLGLWLVSRPVASLTVLTFYLGVTCLVAGVGEIVGGTRWPQRLTGVLWVAVGTVALLAPGPASGALPVVVAAALVVSGVFGVVRVRRERTFDGRLSALLLSLAEVALGVVALAWPDVTLVVVAVLFGVRAVLVGVQFVWDAVMGARRTPEAPPAGRWRRTGRFVVSALALVLAAGTWWATSAARDASPQVTDFYTPPADVPAEPGQLLRAQPFTAEVPDGARAWRILHTTTDHDGAPTIASGLVVVPNAPADDDGRPVIAWAHGTTGQARQCAPSLLPEPFTAGAFPVVLDDVVDRGWAIVATDYVGLGTGGDHAYLVGRVAGHAVLDSVRAARQLTEADLGDDTVVWGHSQGGASALWTAQVQPTYAPDVPLAGTVAMAPASDTVAIADGLGEVTGGSVFAAFVVQGYAAAYDDVDVREVVRPAAVALVERMTSRCLSDEPGVLASVLTALSLGNSDVLRPDTASGPLGERLLENVPLQPGAGPLLVAQGADDVLITPALQRAYVRQVRAGGRDVSFRVHPGHDHLSLVQDEASPFLPELLDWTAARFG